MIVISTQKTLTPVLDKVSMSPYDFRRWWAALQASGEAVSGGRARRSGVTPGTMVTGPFRRVRL